MRSSPSPPDRKSSPSPPHRVSLPPNPSIRSFPPRPLITSAPSVPSRSSAPLVPSIVAARPKHSSPVPPLAGDAPKIRTTVAIATIAACALLRSSALADEPIMLHPFPWVAAHGRRVRSRTAGQSVNAGSSRRSTEALNAGRAGDSLLRPAGGAVLEIRVLGPIEVLQDGQALPLGGAKQRALVADLALHANEVVSAE